jgi:hypothetical protein
VAAAPGKSSEKKQKQYEIDDAANGRSDEIDV